MPASHLEGLNSRTLRVDTSQLVWQSEYTLTCVVTRLGSSELYTVSGEGTANGPGAGGPGAPSTGDLLLCSSHCHLILWEMLDKHDSMCMALQAQNSS